MSCTFDPNSDQANKLSDSIIDMESDLKDRLKRGEDITAPFEQILKDQVEQWTHSEDSLEALADFIKGTCEEFYGRKVRTALHSSLENLQTKLRPAPAVLKTEVQDSDKETPHVDEVRSRAAARTGNYLTRTYGHANAAMSYNIRQVRSKFIKAALINVEEKTITDNDTQLNDNLLNYQQELLDTVLEYLASVGVDSNVLSKIDLSRIDTLEDICKTKFDVPTLIEYFGKALKKKSERAYIKAFNAYATLKDFDNYLQDAFDFININRVWRGKLGRVPGVNKYTFKSVGEHLPEGWQQQGEEKSLAEETPKLVRMLIEYMPFYENGSDVPSETKMLSLDALYYIIGKIKNLAYLPAATAPLINANATPHDPGLIPLYKKYKAFGTDIPTIRDLVGELSGNAMSKYEDLFRLLASPEFMGMHTNNGDIKNEFSKEERSYIWTIYKNIFERDGNSLLDTFLHNTDTSRNYYAFVLQSILNVDRSHFLQYRKDSATGQVHQINLKDNIKNQTRRLHEISINGNLSSVAMLRGVKSKFMTLEEKYGANKADSLFTVTALDGGTAYRLKFSFKAKPSNIPENVTMEYDITNRKFVGLTVGSRTYTSDTLDEYGWDAVKEFIGDVLCLDFSDSRYNYDGEMESAIKQACSEGTQLSYGKLGQIFNLAGSAYFNAYFSHHIMQHPAASNAESYNINDMRKDRNKYYGPESGIQLASDAFEINAICKRDMQVMDNIATAIELTTGSFISGMNKDGAGNMINSITTKRLTGDYFTQVRETISKNPKAAAANFSLIKNAAIFKGIAFIRDFAEFGNSKKITGFSADEFMYASLIMDYLDPLYKGSSDYKDKYVALFPAPNADKTQVIKLLLDLKAANGKLSDTKDGKVRSDKPWRNLDHYEVWEIARQEIGEFYKKVYDNVKMDWAKMNDEVNILRNVEGLPPVLKMTFDILGNKPAFDFNDNFKEWNSAASKAAEALNIKETPADVLHHLLVAVEQAGKNIKLIDQTHFINQGGNLVANPGFKWEIQKHSDDQVFDGFLKQQHAQFITDLLRNDVIIDLSTLKSPSVVTHFTSSLKNWVNARTNEVILGRVYNDAGELVANLNRLSDLAECSYKRADGTIATYKDKDYKLSEFLNRGNNLELNPELAKLNALQYLFGQEYILSSVGHQYNHPAKTSMDDITKFNASSFAAQHKRNVSQTASKHVYIRGLLKGIPSTYRIATVEDVFVRAYNLINSSKKGKHGQDVKPFDGATIVAPELVELENNSLCGDRAGVDKKPFIHGYDAATGSGIIIKTAGFGLTNSRIKNSPNLYGNLLRKMWERNWTREDGTEYTANILQNYRGGEIKYHQTFFKDVEGQYGDKGVIYEIKNILTLADAKKQGVVSNELTLPDANSYVLMLDEVDESGNTINDRGAVAVSGITNKYALWKMFGGENSMSLNRELGILETSEVSIQNVVTACNEVGYVKRGTPYNNEYTQNEVYQPIKYSGIHYIVTAGAIKQGAGNINSNRAYTDPDYKLATWTMAVSDIGVQLNAEHHAHKSLISLMTQVVNALSARGYMNAEAEEVYEALASITVEALQGYTDKNGNILDLNAPLKDDNGQPITDSEGRVIYPFKDKLAETIVKALKRTTERDGNLLNAMAETLIEEAHKGRRITHRDVADMLPISHNGVYTKVLQILTSAITNSGIKMKFNGNLAVLNPCHGVYRFHGNKMRGDFDTIDDLKVEQAKYLTKPVRSASFIDFSRSYRLIPNYKNIPKNNLMAAFEAGQVYTFDSPSAYWDIRKALADNPGAVLIEDIVAGRELKTFNFRFNDKAKSTTYSMWDLDIVQSIWEFDELVNEYKSGAVDKTTLLAKALKIKTDHKLDSVNINDIDNLQKQLRRALQKTLGDIHYGREGQVLIRTYGSRKTKEGPTTTVITVDPSSITRQGYGLIMPAMYHDVFGLRKDDKLSDIISDPKFFLKRLGNAYKLHGINESDYHIALRRLSGDHVYVMDARTANTEHLRRLTNVDKMLIDNKLWRIDRKNKKMYRMQTGDEVYYTSSGVEVIVTNNPIFYAEALDYDLLTPSSTLVPSENTELLNAIINSDSAHCKEFVKAIEHLQKGTVDTQEEQETDDDEDVEVNTSIRISQDNIVNYCDQLDLILYTLGNGDTEHVDRNNPVVKRLKKLSRDTYTSFMVSLKTLAARIPAQSMQSFMAMECEGFDSSGLNSAYVSYMQFWLQGSDLDIDKVNLLGFAFGENGKFIGWHKYFNYANKYTFADSCKMPFPTGRKVEGIISDDYDPTYYRALEFLERDIKHNTFKIKKNPGYEKAIGDFLRASKDVVKLKTEDKALVNFVNEYNAYFDKKADKRVEALKNFVSMYMYNISINELSVIQSQSPIDGSLEGAALDKATAKSVSEEWDAYDVPGNYMAVVKAFIKNMVGKDCVAISASGMKTIEGLVYYVGKLLRHPKDSRVSRALVKNGDTDLRNQKGTDLYICGKRVDMLANAHVDESIAQYLPKEVENILKGIDQDTDALLLISAILGAAVDNAKDPKLGKINGGTQMLPLYIYGIAAGIPFDDLSDVLMSPYGRYIAKLTGTNIFTGRQGRSVISAINYITQGPTKKDVNNATYTLLKNTFKGDDKFSLGKALVASADEQTEDAEGNKEIALVRIIKGLQADEALNKPSAQNYKIQKDLLAILEWNDMYQASKESNYRYSTGESLRELAEGARELQLVRPLFGLNKEVAKDDLDTISFVTKFETIFTERLRSMTSTERQNAKKILEGFPTMERTRVDEDGNQVIDEIENKNYRISFDRFVSDEAYKQQIISLYEKIKHTINIFDAINTIPNYRRYLTAQAVALRSLRGSAKFRTMEAYLPVVYVENSIYKPIDRVRAAKNLRTAIDAAIINKWFRTHQLVLNIPTAGKEGVTTDIMLGNDDANGDFLHWMETMVIPDIKKGLLTHDFRGDAVVENARLARNVFIKGITARKIDRTLTDNASVVYAPTINTMPKTDHQKVIFQEWKQAFDELFTGENKNYRVIDAKGDTHSYNIGNLFFYYNLITNNGASGQSTFGTLFEDLYHNKSADEVNSYNQFISQLDTTSDLILDVDITEEDALLATAPRGSLRSATSRYLKVKSPLTNRTLIYRLKNANKSEEADLTEMDDGEYGGYDMMDEGFSPNDFNPEDYEGETTEDYEMGEDPEMENNESRVEDHEKSADYVEITTISERTPWAFEHKRKVDFDLDAVPNKQEYQDLNNIYTVQGIRSKDEDNKDKFEVTALYYKGKKETRTFEQIGELGKAAKVQARAAELRQWFPGMSDAELQHTAETQITKELKDLIQAIRYPRTGVAYYNNAEHTVLENDTLVSLLNELYNTEC